MAATMGGACVDLRLRVHENDHDRECAQKGGARLGALACCGRGIEPESAGVTLGNNDRTDCDLRTGSAPGVNPAWKFGRECGAVWKHSGACFVVAA